MPWMQVPKIERPPRPFRVNVQRPRIERPTPPPKPTKPPDIEGWKWRWRD